MPGSTPLLVRALTPRLSTVALGALLAALQLRARRTLPVRVLKALGALLLLLNWRAFPLAWHIRLFYDIPIWRRLWYKRIDAYTAGDRSQSWNPFDPVVYTSRVDWSACDWNQHLSNSSYAVALDKARFWWLLERVGPAMGPELVWSPLGATTYTFLREIPVFAKYSVSVQTLSWDSKWIYYLARFTTVGKDGSEVLHAVALSKSTFKMRGSRLTMPPARVLSSSGAWRYTEDSLVDGKKENENWARTARLRKAGKAREWLRYGAWKVAQEKKMSSTATATNSGTSTPATGSGAVTPTDSKSQRKEEKPPLYEEGWDSDGMEMFEKERAERYTKFVKDVPAVMDSWALAA